MTILFLLNQYLIMRECNSWSDHDSNKEPQLIVTSLWAGQFKNRGWILDISKRVLSTPKYPEWLLGPPTLLSLNYNKTHFIKFQTKKQNEAIIQIVVPNSINSNINSTKFLGLIIDNSLSWKDHITTITS